MRHIQNMTNIITRHMSMRPVLMAAVVALVLVVSIPTGAQEEFDEAFVFFELNNTDEDLGIHAKIDGDPWKWIKIRDHRRRKVLEVRNKLRLRRQGLTELFFESAEPEFGDLSPEDFFRRFPEGEYKIVGRTLEGDELESFTNLTHVMPAPPEVFVNRISAAEDCDADLPVVSVPVIIRWRPVRMSHPDSEGGGAGVQPPVPITVLNYEVVVEIDETPWVTSTVLPPTARRFKVPREILALAEDGDEIKFEVLVREASYNQTAVESCFVIQK